MPALQRRAGFAVLAAAIAAVPASAATTHWWRFESTPAFSADSTGAADLRVGSAAESFAPARTGAGSAFPRWLTPRLGTPNAQAARLGGSGHMVTAPLLAPNDDFTVECFARFDSEVAGAANVLVGAGRGWALEMQLDRWAGARERELVFAGSTDPWTRIFVPSGIVLELGVDYYVAASFRVSPPEVTFYVQDLSDGTPLTTTVKSHAGERLVLGSELSVGGEMAGLIDEVRISSPALAPEELLIHGGPKTPAPSDPLAALVVGATLGGVTDWR